MANILVLPTCAHVDTAAVAQAIAAALPDAAVFNPFAEADQAESLIAAYCSSCSSAKVSDAALAEKMIAEGKADDWMDLLVGEVATLNKQNVVIQGISPNAETAFLSAQNVSLATAFNAQVIFVAADEAKAEQKVALAKQAFNGFAVDFAGVVGNAAAAQANGLADLGATGSLNAAALAQIAAVSTDRVSPAQFRFNMMDAAQKANKRIVLPEGAEPRTVRAAAICHEKKIARCVLLATRAEVEAVAKEQNITLPESLEIIDPATLVEQYVTPMCELRKSKGMTPEQAREQLQDTVVLGTMMMAQNDVDGLVSGAVHTTANTIRPALQLIKTAPGESIVSSVFFMLLPGQVVVYGDCAVNPNPTAEQLADIAIQSAKSAKAFGIEPRVAMISYSTINSGSGPDVDLVVEATRIVKAKAPELAVDGPLQYDAAVVADVAKSKAPNSPVAGKANVFIFPNLTTGNCTYKAVQRNANVLSVGPMLQGLRKPVNDLSRGALVEDIVYTIALTAIQATQI
ncbi:phosphate acetyltransferase [Kingella negevensis]|uniref:Phosphate acetyltransferase n=1 Tax=Kingella negevensis TaxID=1522312 RepID=A0A238TG44_9NEIS|nr:phosphate acetyltransferase [Kingella negevensis]MDK4679726.1 phosphate acetyltransferase [Kingella negevensis]MDK4682556.1 phosphate acetyltransferase [Kingella negevensis]MDK4684429.1 phosphate acetyltransferase [Kingella negevensis]MDK4690752.1 phosphate acetyltransferase [Kingella negevensis]MDK4694100.1 phosphate acetyltransferase [Kingella negevensis]